MTTAHTTSVTTQLPAAATAVAQAWGLGDALIVGEAGSTRPDVSFADQAVLVEFSGRVSGELTVLVDAEIAQQLMDSPAAPVDLIAALGPATTAALLALGEVVAGAAQVLTPDAAIDRILSQRDAGAVTLSDEGEVRVIVAMSAAAEPPAPPAEAIPSQARGAASAAAAGPAAERLDLLRGVNMQATVELGRTAMTINDLLALRSGTVIELDRAAGAPADLYVNGRLIAHGEVVVVDENYGLRILKVVADEAGR